MAATLSPLQLQAGYALFQNSGLRPSEALASAVKSYDDLAFISGLLKTIKIGSSMIVANPAPPPDMTSAISPANLAALQSIGGITCPALGDAIPTLQVIGAPPLRTTFPMPVIPGSAPGFTGYLLYLANVYLGNGDLSKFAQLFNAAQGYVQTTNIFINSAVNAETYLENTFTTMDDLVTGDLTQVNLDTQGFGQDLEKCGNLVDLARVADLGFPFPLIQQVVRQGGLTPSLVSALTIVGVNENIVLDLVNPKLVVTDTIQKQMYQAMTLIRGNDLLDILRILGMARQQVISQGRSSFASVDSRLSDPCGQDSPTGLPLVNIQTMADLLDPSKIFPNSYSTLTTPICGCDEPPPLPIDPGTMIFTSRNPPSGPTVYPQTNDAWNPFLNDTGVWNFTGTIFDSRNPPGGGVTPQTWPRWSEFMNAHAVWETDILAPTFVRSYTINIPTAGDYLFTAQCDDRCTISIDGIVVIELSQAFKGPPNTRTIYLDAGSHTLDIDAVNCPKVGGFALLIERGPLTVDTFTRTYSLYFPVDGYYTFTGQADNFADFLLDGKSLFSTADFIGPPGSTTQLVTKGDHTITLNGTNSEGPAGIGFTVVFQAAVRGNSNLRAIYLPNPANVPTVNASLTDNLPVSVMPTYERLSRIVPFELALANQALAVSLQQITNITKMTLPELALAYLNAETNKGLKDINNQDKAVPTDVTDYYKNTYATGTGENGTILMTDVIGTLAGTVHVEALTKCVAILQKLQSAGGLTQLKNVYDTMLKCVNGTYADPGVPGGVVIPVGQPATGTYATIDEAIVALIPLAEAQVTSIAGSYAAEVASLNAEFTAMTAQLNLETNQQQRAGIILGELQANSQVNIQGFLFALPSYAKDTSVGGTASLIQSVADTGTPGGQSIIAVMREGRTAAGLDDTGVGRANELSDQPATPPPQMSTVPAKYTAAEAQAKLIY